ncbi:hypothetical protein BDV93DRAFT_561770 [Ceratobasidium sp. AG-I]|nr:hypothetical protein BDV93DRAFT_561770 [Ceratobasidium sp. AG-I]
MPPAPRTSKKPTPRDTFYWPKPKIEELISEASNIQNVRTLLGKQEPGENTSGDTKVKVYGRIAATLFPAEYSANPKLWKRRVQHKWEHLCNAYRTAAKRLRRTGEGVKGDSQIEDSDTTGSGINEVELQHYIPATGPDHNTPDVARNIWGELFIRFPRMHELLSTRPNQVPIAVTTALTPSGPTTVYHQPPSESGDYDSADDSSAPILSTPDMPAVDSYEATASVVNRKRTTAHPSNQIRAASKAAGNMSKVGHHRSSIEDRFLEIQTQLQSRIFERDKHARKMAERQQVLQERRLLLEEFKLGLLKPEEYRIAVARLEGGASENVFLPSLPSPLSSHAANSESPNLSPEWNTLGLSFGSDFASPSDP